MNADKVENPTRNGYAFIGWSGKRNGTVNITDRVLMQEYDTTVYAVWDRVNSVTLKQAPNITNYVIGQKLDPSGLVVTVNLENSGTKDISYNEFNKYNFRFNVGDKISEDNDAVTFTYAGISDGSLRYDISVRRVQNMELIDARTTSYYVGSRLDPIGIRLMVNYDDGTKEEIVITNNNKSIFEFTPTLDTDLTESDTQVTITYGSKSVTFNIIVKTKSSGGSSNRGGGGGGGGGGGVKLNNGLNPFATATPTVTVVGSLKNISAVVDGSFCSWMVDAITGKWKLNAVDANGHEISAKNGFYLVNNIVKQLVNGSSVDVIINDTYYFDSNGDIVTGWIETADSKWYFFENAKNDNEGKMQIGWKDISGSWYYFGPDGAMYQNQVTPDGYLIDNEGKWLQS